MHPIANPEFVAALATSTSVGAAMVLLAVRKGLLERRVPRLCPSCGVALGAGRRCRCSR